MQAMRQRDQRILGKHISTYPKEKEMTFDEMLIWHEKYDPEPHMIRYWGVSGASTFIGVVLCFFGQTEGFGVLLFSACWILYEALSAFNKNLRNMEFEALLEMKADKAPTWKVDAAIRLTGDIIEGQLWAVECEEAHINDCQLCGG